MISEWFTPQNLADLQLSSLPSSRFRINEKAKKENWKCRPRYGVGGGLEYHVSALPEAAQMELIEKQVGPAALDALASNPARYMELEKPGTPTYNAAERRNAKLIIVQLFDQFRETTCLTIQKAERPFLKFYAKERACGHSSMVPAWVFDIYPEFSIQSLRRWRRIRREEDAFKALGGRYGNRKGSGVIERAEDGELRQYIIALMLKQPHLNGGHMRDLCRAKFGETVMVKDARGRREEKDLPHVRTFERFMCEWRAENGEMHERLTNPDGHKNKFQLGLGKADAGIERLNQLWEIDASPADVLCQDGRYSLYGIIDVWSRRAMYMVTKTPRTEAALVLIRKAILEWGVPESIRTDNGSDFTSQRFMGALLALGIYQDVCPPFSGEKKPFIERSFHTLQHDLMPLLPGYIGHSVKDRKEIESRRAFAARLGENAEKSFAVELSHTDLQGKIDQWVENKYLHKQHGGLGGQTPWLKAMSWTAPIKKIENPRALDLLLAPVAGNGGFRTIGKKGIRLDGGSFFDGGLIPYVGKRVLVRCNPEDMGVIYCFDEDGKFISEARCFDRAGVDPVAAAAQAKKAQKDFEKERIEPLRREMRKLTPAKMADDYLGIAAKDKGTLTAFPKQSESYQNEGLSEAAKAVDSTSSVYDLDLDKFRKEFLEQKNAPKELSDEERWWARAQDIETRRAAGETLNSADAKWFGWVEQQSWYHARREFEQMRKNHDDVNGVPLPT